MTDLTDEAVKALLPKAEAVGDHYVADFCRAILDARAELAQARADAQAAVALVVERCAEVVPQGWCEPETANTIMDVELGMAIQAVIRRLAPIDGLALVRELRAERDDLAHVLDAREASYGISSNGNMWRFWSEKAQETSARNKALRAERDTLAATLAVLEAKVAGLRDFVDDFAKAKIDALRYSPPYGSSPEDEPDPVVDAKTVWAWQADAKAALSHIKRGKTNG